MGRGSVRLDNLPQPAVPCKGARPGVAPNPIPPPSGGRPFVSLPRHIADDGTLPPFAKAVLLVLAGYAWGNKAVCWPSNASIASKVGRSVGHVKRCLADLEERGLIEREATDAYRTGRVIRLLWRSTPVASAPPPPGAPARPEAIQSQGKKKERPESDSCSGSTPPPAGEKGELVASDDELAQLEQWAAGSDPVLAKLGRCALKLAGVIEGVITADAPAPQV